MRKALPVMAASEKPVCCIEDGQMVGIVDRDAVLRAIAEEGELDVSTIVGGRTTRRLAALVSARPVVARPSRPGRGDPRRDVVAYSRLEGRVPVAERPRLERAAGDILDSFQTWLIDQRIAEGRGLVFTIFDGFASSRTTSSRWFNDLLHLDDLDRDGRRRHAPLVALRRAEAPRVWALAAFATFALSGLWVESMETLALMLAAVGSRSSSAYRWASRQGARRASTAR